MSKPPIDQSPALIASARSYLSAMVTPVLRLGVTGLAGAGKTVFITALVRNLTAGGRLPFFSACAEGRILACYLEPQPDDDIPRFDYEKHLSALLATPPVWPESTRRISQLRVTIEYVPSGTLWRSLGARKLHVDIVDYPGEWLADLQMLELSYPEWAARQIALARTPFRINFASPWLKHLATLDPAAAQSEDQARAAAAVFSRYLTIARERGAALGTLGPGRFLMAGDLDGSPMLTFVPLDLAPDAKIAGGTFAAMMARRYESYRQHVVKPFFRQHFSRIDRQIVLVDALSALNHGQAAVEQLTEALETSLRAFRPGARTWLSRIVGRRIDRIAFAAAKADHLPHTSHDRLEAALRLMVAAASRRTQAAGGEVRVMALAAIRATREQRMSDAGEDLICVSGTPIAGETIDGRTFDGRAPLAIFPGDLPAEPDLAVGPSSRPLDVRFVRFAPPKLSDPRLPDPGQPPWPHIRLDRAIEFLIGDYLR